MASSSLAVCALATARLKYASWSIGLSRTASVQSAIALSYWPLLLYIRVGLLHEPLPTIPWIAGEISTSFLNKQPCIPKFPQVIFHCPIADVQVTADAIL